MRNIALLLRYDGASYHGWQTQQNAVTIQETLEQALRRLTGEKIPRGVAGCSRTDAGVHARSYVANFASACTIPAERFPAAIRPYLPPDISVRAAKDMPEEFHARFSCTGKEYIYRIYHGNEPDPFLHQRAMYHPYRLNIEKMNEAAACLRGTHDFRALMAAGATVQNTVRTIYDCTVSQTDVEIQVTVSADGFLYNMVRILAGTLIAVSDGKFQPEMLSEMIERGDRTKLGMTLPPYGLYLNRIWYPQGEAQTLFI